MGLIMRFREFAFNSPTDNFTKARLDSINKQKKFLTIQKKKIALQKTKEKAAKLSKDISTAAS